MNQNDTYDALKDYLARSDRYRVIALKGAWGTGKTFLWQRLAESMSKSDIPPIYCSLFGKNSMDEVKKALLGETLSTISDGAATVQNVLGGVFEKVTKVAGTFIKGADAVGQLTAGVVGQISGAILERAIEGRLVVLDDFERRGRDLDVIATLGLVDYLKTRNCRVLFIFNEQRIGEQKDKDAFAQFREKVIDIELQLDVSPQEVYDIAAAGRNVPYAEQTHKHFVALDVSNIRVATRVLNVVENVFLNKLQLDELLLKGTLRAAITLTAVYFKGVPDAPEFDALVQGTHGFGFLFAESLSDEQRHVREFGAEFLGDVDDAFVALLVTHLTTGAPLHTEFNSYWQQRELNLQGVARREQLTTWLRDVWWNPRVIESDLVQAAEGILPHVATRLTIDECQRVYEALIEIDAPQAETFLAEASARIRENGTEEDIQRAGFTLNRETQFAPAILAAAQDRMAQLKPCPSLEAAVEKVAAGNGYGALDAAVITEATAEQFVDVFYGATVDTLPVLLRFWQHLGEGNLASVIPHVSAAASHLVATEPNSRLARILARSIRDNPSLLQTANIVLSADVGSDAGA